MATNSFNGKYTMARPDGNSKFVSPLCSFRGIKLYSPGYSPGKSQREPPASQPLFDLFLTPIPTELESLDTGIHLQLTANIS